VMRVFGYENDAGRLTLESLGKILS
jgi:hypothetical protein